MYVVTVGPECSPTQVEGFPEKVALKKPTKKDGKEIKERPFERSCVGSLHVRPNSSMTITKDEFEFLKARSSVGRHIYLAKDLYEKDEGPPSEPPASESDAFAPPFESI